MEAYGIRECSVKILRLTPEEISMLVRPRKKISQASANQYRSISPEKIETEIVEDEGNS